MNALEQAFLAAATEGGGPAQVFHVDPDAAVECGSGRNPLDGMALTHWSRD
ncbi:hypothetical protein H7J51_17915 [Mycobacterium crocinum]|uniref:Uncharacterized protein n=1 Tax=Mycolicibacterium crocinum TaxID=388459 RepID=A0ABY3TU99_9MYCO|nr:hypothetical protein [Mycolicibacterium crocinum]MCV7217150.1 hypothetical protein [Mycolicibacterium crocinum]ULN42894.1 hypothetical protein MI149_07320 [Mycolicibacterium crocinum]